MKILLAMFAVICAETAAAKPLSASTGARNLAILVYAEKRCPALRINFALISKAMDGAGIKADDLAAAVSKEGAAAGPQLDEKFGGIPDHQFCELMEDMFGPGGTTAENFLKKR